MKAYEGAAANGISKQSGGRYWGMMVLWYQRALALLECIKGTYIQKSLKISSWG